MEGTMNNIRAWASACTYVGGANATLGLLWLTMRLEPNPGHLLAGGMILVALGAVLHNQARR